MNTVDLEAMFQEQMSMVQEENPLMPLAEQVEVAMSWVLDDLHRRVGWIAERRHLAHVEAVNKAFYG
jgi:hypothetical protein